MSPYSRGTALAALAALLFGATVPVVKVTSTGSGAFATAALLYLGSALGARLGGPIASRGPRLTRAHLPRVVVLAIFGGAIAPACLAWGLSRTSAIAGALMLNLEAVFTTVLASALYREHLGRRFLAAIGLMLAGGALLAGGAASPAGARSFDVGLLAVAAATMAWALDSALMRPLADLDPRAVVLAKSVLGAALSTLAALSLGERWPAGPSIAALVIAGALGYGLSLRAYLGAQRVMGASRTASVFALAPFIGAAIALIAGDRTDLPPVAAATALFGFATWLHLTEHHAHAHRHEAIEHEHEHRHDDGHHDHAHDEPVVGAHSHRHHHEAVEHEHAHGADLHHQHGHFGAKRTPDR